MKLIRNSNTTTYGSSWSVSHVQINLICKLVCYCYESSWSVTVTQQLTDQVDSYIPDRATTFCVPRLSPSTTATLNTGTFTFTTPNRSQRTHEPETMPHKKEKTREAHATKMAYSAFLKKINVFKEERSQGHFCHLKTLLVHQQKCWVQLTNHFHYSFGPMNNIWNLAIAKCIFLFLCIFVFFPYIILFQKLNLEI